MIALVLVVIGFALMFGSDLARSLVKPFIGLVLVVSLAPHLLSRCASAPGATTGPANHGVSSWVLAAFFALAGVGWVLWKLRAVRAKREHARLRRDGRPRGRALPPAPEEEP